ncbi:ROK family protein [Streptomonospora nanhaiensis]|uniref:Putative NBD/HSP70 family sugar kinase n=1 Tax=Streptomonospora nanhaiensis TaxID=1323731 RepID=A0A853BPU0_9ACTN|nr:ROK family transcriptional regulator [Streptomonospora nanhaiensis]MBV2365947.1 ROK family transcriptional regulator [Streptomonospora nanhaiensis]MBX9388875.1 ROK family transcriptional regulator [Streptomonospora nanhaiensis]NYI96617.1 putative NBD/HSP70 family sugar kinase [Streptomonospora nanhaiensis]
MADTAHTARAADPAGPVNLVGPAHTADIPDVGAGPAGLQDVRGTNLGLVLRAVRALAPCSRAAVAAATGLNKTTVSSLVADLISRGLLRETGESAERRVGRPGVMLALDHRTIAAIGLEVNVDYLSVVAVDLLERDLVTRHLPFDARAAGPDACARRIAEAVRAVAGDPALRDRAVIGVSVGVPGLVDSPTGTITRAPNLGWSHTPLRARLLELLASPGAVPGAPAAPPPVLVDNDANLGAVAEYRSGHRARTRDLVYITGEVGIGAGVLVDGELLRGSSGFAGEIGHTRMVEDGPACGCGRRGCLEALAGIEAILRSALPDRFPGGALTRADLAGLVAAAVERAGAGDPVAVAALRAAGTWLGRGAALLVNLLNPGAVVLGGYFVPLAPWLLPECRAAVRELAFAPDAAGCVVEPSVLGLSAAARGGAMAMVDALEGGRLPLPPPRAAVPAGGG